MNLRDCQPGLRVRFNHDQQWKYGKVLANSTGNDKTVMVQPDEGGDPIPLLTRNLQHAPPFYGVKLTIPRHLITKILMDERLLVLELDASSTYHAGQTHPLNIYTLPRDMDGESKGLYLSAEEGKMTLSKTESQ